MRLNRHEDEGRCAAGFACVRVVDGAVRGEIGRGLLVLVGIAAATTTDDAARLAARSRGCACSRTTRAASIARWSTPAEPRSS